MLKKDQIIQGQIAYLDDSSNGVIMAGKDKVFVRNVLAKESVKVKVIKRLQEGYSAKLLEVVKADPQRVKPQCGIYDKCGSCQLMHVSHEGQKALKLQGLSKLCAKSKNLQLKATTVYDMKDPYHYRNKMIVGFSKNKQGQLQAGFYEEFSHNIIAYDTCLLHPEICDEIIHTICDLMKKLRIEPYEEDKRKGLLRHVILRYGMVSKQIMVVLVLNQQVFPMRKAFVSELTKQHPEITTIVQNVNTRQTSVVLGDQERVLYGPGFIEDTLCGLKFKISAKSFYQINHEQCETLYQKAISLLNLQGNEVILDAYCGIGTIGMYASKFAKQVIGVELNKDAVEDAKENAQLNKIKNIRFICDDATKFIRKMAMKKEHLDVVILDPPRAGSTKEFIESVAHLHPKKVLYISCNPQTQMRDLEVFKQYGYTSNEVFGVDMFPNTFHTESVTMLTQSKQAYKPRNDHSKSNNYQNKKNPHNQRREDYKPSRNNNHNKGNNKGRR